MTDTAQYEILDLGGMPGFGTIRANALNNASQIAGTLTQDAIEAEEPSLDFHGFLWSEGQMTSLGDCLPKSINTHGLIAGSIYHGLSSVPVVTAVFGNAERMKPLNLRVGDDKSSYSMAEAINERGIVVGFSKSSQTNKIPCLWEDEMLRPLPLPKGYQGGSAAAVNDRGQIAGEVWASIEADSHAVLWEADRVTFLNEPPGCGQSRAVALNNRGAVLLRGIHSNLAAMTNQVMENNMLDANASQAFTYQETSFLWQKGQMTVIDGQAVSLNDANQIVGWTALVPGQKPIAFLWQEGNFWDLNALIPNGSDWHLLRANDINNKGQIVGYGHHQGKCRAFLLSPITK